MPNLRGVMQRARAIREAALAPIPESEPGKELGNRRGAPVDAPAEKEPAAELRSGDRAPRAAAVETDEEEAERPARRMVERATPLHRALGSGSVERDEDGRGGENAREAASRDRNFAP